MNKTDLIYFLEVARTQHVSRAAERLGITQPALSYCLKRLEEEAGAELFLRSKKGVALTAAGQRLQAEAQELLSQWDRVLNSVREEVNEVAGRIRFGCHTAVAQYTLPVLIPKLLKDYPKLEVELTHGLSRHVTEQVISSKLDAAFAVNPVEHEDLVIKEVCRDQVALWKHRNCQNPDVLMVEPSLLQTQELLRKIAKKGFHFKRIVESPSLEVLAQLMSSGAGYSILPARVVKAMSDEKVEAVEGSPTFQDRICLVYKRELLKTMKGKSFVKAVGEMRLS